MNVQIIGIDCATKPEKVGLALAQFSDGTLRIQQACDGGSDQAAMFAQVARWIDDSKLQTLLALDAPLGWPIAMHQLLHDHRAGHWIPMPATDEPDPLFSRATDHLVTAYFKKRPLEIGADRISRTARWALNALGEISRARGRSNSIPLAWAVPLSEPVSAIEVYPAVTLKFYGALRKGYKTPETSSVRQAVVSKVRENHANLSMTNAIAEAMENDADVLDAVACAIAGADMLTGRSDAPSKHGCDQLAKIEGWIWAPLSAARLSASPSPSPINTIPE